MRPIFIIGYMASGKTTLGKALARELKRPFIDLDFYIEQRFRKKITEIFDQRGEEGFRKMEANMLREVGEMEDVIVSCGGGTPCFFDNMEFILSKGCSVWLDTGVDCIVRRLLCAKTKRPLVMDRSEEEIRSIVNEHLKVRLPFYSRADIRFPGEELESREEIARSIERLRPLLPLRENQEITLDIGIPTDGDPQLGTPFQMPDTGTVTPLSNQIIGLGFHWQQVIETILPGKVFINPDSSSPFRLINRLPLEQYLEAVVGSEMNPAAPLEFLKAHAIISRSWALGKIMNPVLSGSSRNLSEPGTLIIWEDNEEHTGFDLCSDDHCQRYQGVREVSPEAREAIRSTAGIVITTPEGKLVDARFSKCCGGHTELFSTCWQEREEPSLESFDDPWCDLSSLSSADRLHLLRTILKEYDLANEGGFRWEVTLSRQEVERNLDRKFNRKIGRLTGIKVLRRGPSGRIKLMELTGTEGHLVVGKELTVRKLFSDTHLYSSAFDIEWTGKEKESLKLTGKGWGHGVGLCQIGAAHMAACGRSFREILEFYYPGSVIRNLDEM